MKKLLGISLVAVLATTPLMASAQVGDVINTDPSNVDGTGVATTTKPLFTLAKEAATDGNAASAGYVKGAYNAAIKAVNAVHNEVAELDQDLDGKANISLDNINAAGQNVIKGIVKTDAADGDYDNTNSGLRATTIQTAIDELDTTLDGLGDTYATKTEVTANINGATVTANNVSLDVAGTPTGTVAGSLTDTSVTVSANLPESVDIMNVWGSDTATTLALNNAATATTLNGNVTNAAIGATFTGTGITSGTATGTVTSTITAPATYIED